MPSKSQSSTQTVKPWNMDALKGVQSDASGLYGAGGFSFSPYTGDRVAGFGNTSQMGQNAIIQQARGGTPGTDAAIGTLTGMMDGDAVYRDMDGVRSSILGSAIPAATSMFSGSGMANSSAAQAGVGKAATAALAPFEYGAWENSQNRALSAAQAMPGLEAAQYLPGTMLSQVGAAQDAMAQSEIDASMDYWNERQSQDYDALARYASLLGGLGGMGSTTTGTAPGASTAQTVGGSALSGLGMYGMLAANPATAPFALAGGIGSGLLGLL